MANSEEENRDGKTEAGALRSDTQDQPPEGGEQAAPPAEEQAAAEPVAQGHAAAGAARRRALFPALAATAIVGAILGAGASLGLRYLTEPPASASLINERINERINEHMAALNARIDSLEKKADTSATAARAAASAIESRVAAAETAAREATEIANSLKSQVEKAAEMPASAAPQSDGTAAAAPDLAPLQARITDLEQKLAALGQSLSAPKDATRAEPDKDTAAAKEASRAQAIAVAAQSLLHKLDRGESFATQLSALDSLGAGREWLATLHAIPGASVRSERQLVEQFASLAPQIIAASASQTNEVESLLDRLARDAKALVHVHRADEVEALGAEGLVAKIEKALHSGDLETAVKSWQELPAAAISVSKNWGEEAEARRGALEAARAIEGEAMATLSKPKT